MTEFNGLLPEALTYLQALDVQSGDELALTSNGLKVVVRGTLDPDGDFYGTVDAASGAYNDYLHHSDVGYPVDGLAQWERELLAPVETANPEPEVVVDMVNHPPHYTHYQGFEAIDIVEQLDYLTGTAVKYLLRAGHKDNELQDLDKAIFYINRRKSNILGTTERFV